METLWHDLAFGIRMLFKNPRFTAVAVLSLAIGIGANSAIFSVTNTLLLRPLPYKQADRLVILWNRSPGLNVAQDWLSLGEYLDIKTQNHVFDQVSISIDSSFNLTGHGPPERVEGARVSSSLFPLMGAQPMFGRVFLPDEDQPGKALTVILSNGFWQRRFAADRGIIGKDSDSQRELTESVLLGLMGGLLGLVIAVVAIRVLRAFGPESIPRLSEIGLDGRSVGIHISCFTVYWNCFRIGAGPAGLSL